MPPSESHLGEDQRLKLLDLLYGYSTCPEDEKAAARTALYRALDEFRAPLGIGRQEVIDYLRAFHFKDYYRARKRHERGEL